MSCECVCHEAESIYPREKSGHCWVCKNGMTIIKDPTPLSTDPIKDKNGN